MTTLVPAGITSLTTPDALLDLLLTMSQNVTHASVIDNIYALPPGDMTKKIGSISIAASMSVKRVIEGVTSQAGINLPDEWKVNGSPNMSMLAMAGHLIFMLENSKLTAAGRKSKKVYMKSIGGYKNILKFGSEGVIPAKPKRTEILREWSARLEGADLVKAYKVLGAKFPHIVDTGGVNKIMSFLRIPITYIIKPILSPFLMIAKLLLGRLRFLLFLWLFFSFKYVSLKKAPVAIVEGIAAITVTSAKKLDKRMEAVGPYPEIKETIIDSYKDLEIDYVRKFIGDSFSDALKMYKESDAIPLISYLDWATFDTDIADESATGPDNSDFEMDNKEREVTLEEPVENFEDDRSDEQVNSGNEEEKMRDEVNYDNFDNQL